MKEINDLIQILETNKNLKRYRISGCYDCLHHLHYLHIILLNSNYDDTIIDIVAPAEEVEKLLIERKLLWW